MLSAGAILIISFTIEETIPRILWLTMTSMWWFHFAPKVFAKRSATVYDKVRMFNINLTGANVPRKWGVVIKTDDEHYIYYDRDLSNLLKRVSKLHPDIKDFVDKQVKSPEIVRADMGGLIRAIEEDLGVLIGMPPTAMLMPRGMTELLARRENNDLEG